MYVDHINRRVSLLLAISPSLPFCPSSNCCRWYHHYWQRAFAMRERERLRRAIHQRKEERRKTTSSFVMRQFLSLSLCGLSSVRFDAQEEVQYECLAHERTGMITENAHARARESAVFDMLVFQLIRHSLSCVLD